VNLFPKINATFLCYKQLSTMLRYSNYTQGLNNLVFRPVRVYICNLVTLRLFMNLKTYGGCDSNKFAECTIVAWGDDIMEPSLVGYRI